ncbi:Golgin subfamily A member 7/ERF4 family-domain-containing protein [Glomus cerebriforme]|uniref:Ras modification protein ERF4 n=1 Tax=Glomus cerebriforme TaxID=658196 RepID=A0A397TH41_9GLOM|nr:Golgin subfamily A member 7/ERF4 family-domain-containing protein [Glomus cerebriforme]
MDNKVGQNDKQKNVAEEEVAPPQNMRENVIVKDQIEGEKEVGSSTTSTQKYVVVGVTNQSSTTEVEAIASSSLESPKAQKTALQSDYILTSQSTSSSIPTTSSSPYKPITNFFKPENHISSGSQSHTHYSNTDGGQKNIAENGTLRLAEMENSSPSISSGQPDALSSNISTSEITKPKRIIRIDRDYTRGEMCQFQTAFPLEIDGRINPRRFQQTINTLNELLSKAHNPKYNFFDNCLACITIYTSTLCLRSHFDRMIEEICRFLDSENISLYNSQGLNFRDPRRTSFLFLELELY